MTEQGLIDLSPLDSKTGARHVFIVNRNGLCNRIVFHDKHKIIVVISKYVNVAQFL